jgi:peptidoglycan/xylan/chitin deacetylase (PgdA/CDA1 family)
MRPSTGVARRAVFHPLVVVPALAVVLVLGWQRYTERAPAFARPDGTNLLLTAESAAKGDADGGWRATAGADDGASLHTVRGAVTSTARQLEITRNVSGDITLSSPQVGVATDRSYLYKAYSTGPAFTLLARYHYRDGSDRLVELRDVPAHDGWATASATFDSGKDIRAVSFVYRFAATGTLTVDGAYLEADRDVVVDPPAASGPNLIPNPALAPDSTGQPVDWSPYQYGWLDASFGYEHDDRGNYLQTVIRNSRDGEAKWRYPPIPVSPDQAFQFTATYRSDLPVDVVAEFAEPSGQRQYQNLETVLPSGEWTTLTEHLQVPSGATSLVLTLVSHGDGTTAVRDYALVDTTRPGARRWSRPLVSLAFEAGWQSQYDTALPLLERHGYTGTFYVNPATLATPYYMTSAELGALDRAGDEIACNGYGYEDLTSLPADGIETQLHTGQRALADAGFRAADVALPFGRSDEQVQWYAREYYASVLGSDPGLNTRQNFDPADLKVFYVDSRTSADDLAHALDQARSDNGWLILVYRPVAPSAGEAALARSAGAAVTRQDFEAQLQLIGDSGIPVEPVAQAVAEIRRE